MKSFIKKSNSGFSLVELMIGVAILAIILIPITSAIVSSGNFVSDSYELSDATMLAESLAEQFEVMDISELLETPSSSTIPTVHTETGDVTGAFVVPDGGSNAYNPLTVSPSAPYFIEYKGLISGYSTYNAVVTINPAPNNSGFDVINATPVFQNFDVGFVASKEADSENDFDELSWSAFKLEAATKGYDLNDAAFTTNRDSLSQDRNITLEIDEKTDSSNNKTIHMSMTYIYSYVYPSSTGNFYDGKTYEWYKTISLTDIGGIPVPDVSVGEKYPTVFLSIFPWYHGEDNITIINIFDFPITVAINKQADPNVTEAVLADNEANHEGFNVDILELDPTERNLQIISNLTQNLSGIGLPVSAEFSINRTIFTPNETTGSLLAAEPIDRIFKVGIEIYETNTSGSSIYPPGAVYDVDFIKLR